MKRQHPYSDKCRCARCQAVKRLVSMQRIQYKYELRNIGK